MASFFDDEAEVGTTDEEDEMENDSKSIKVSKFGKKVCQSRSCVIVHTRSK